MRRHPRFPRHEIEARRCRDMRLHDTRSWALVALGAALLCAGARPSSAETLFWPARLDNRCGVRNSAIAVGDLNGDQIPDVAATSRLCSPMNARASENRPRSIITSMAASAYCGSVGSSTAAAW